MLVIKSEKLEFDPSDLLKEQWRNLVHEAQDKANIHFDLENDDTVGNISRISFPSKSSIRDNDIYYVQLCAAGGDWQSPTNYFRIQTKDGINKKEMFVFIPSKKEGNGNLCKGKTGYIPVENQTKKDDQRDEKKCRNAVKHFLSSWANRSLEY